MQTKGVNNVKYRKVVTSTIQSPSVIFTNKNKQPIEPIPFNSTKSDTYT